jgi:hypothetical protein
MVDGKAEGSRPRFALDDASLGQAGVILGLGRFWYKWFAG